jgi:hypothetical protein
MINDLSAYMAGELAKQLALEKDKILHACVRNVVGPSVRIKDVIITGRIRCEQAADSKSELWSLDGKPLVEIWAPETRDEPTPDGNGTRMVVSISYRMIK